MTLEEFRALVEIQGCRVVVDESIFSPKTKIYVGIHYPGGKCLGGHGQTEDEAFTEMYRRWEMYEGVTL